MQRDSLRCAKAAWRPVGVLTAIEPRLYFIKDAKHSLYCAQGEDSLALRQGGTVPSGGRAAVYAADMRGAVSLQLYPDGYEWVEPRPLPISYGYASHRVHAGACTLL